MYQILLIRHGAKARGAHEYDAPKRISEVFEATSDRGRSLFAKYFYHNPGLRVARRDMIGEACEADLAVRLFANYDAAGNRNGDFVVGDSNGKRRRPKTRGLLRRWQPLTMQQRGKSNPHLRA